MVKTCFTITHITEPFQMHINNHEELICFFLYKSSSHALIIGQPWLCHHELHVNWRMGEITEWEKDCANQCLDNPDQEEVIAEINLFSANSVTDSEYPDLSSVPSCYHLLREVFSKTKAMSLPPQWPYDCAIDLIPGSTIPKGRLYSVSAPEREAMKEYIETLLKASLIRSLSSQAGAGFIFVGKKDGSLRPCIDS